MKPQNAKDSICWRLNLLKTHWCTMHYIVNHFDLRHFPPPTIKIFYLLSPPPHRVDPPTPPDIIMQSGAHFFDGLREQLVNQLVTDDNYISPWDVVIALWLCVSPELTWIKVIQYHLENRYENKQFNQQ